jgi:biotin transport system substrate-specific component
MQGKALSFSRPKLKGFGLVLMFTALMVLASQIRIPLFFTPIPVTLQTLVLFLTIVYLGKKAVYSLMLYMIIGLSGFSVFTSGGAGLLYLLGPSGGYLLGFIVSALIIPFALKRSSHQMLSFVSAFSCFLLALSIIYGLGSYWLSTVSGISLSETVALGVAPFIGVDLIKAVIAALIFAGKGKN